MGSRDRLPTLATRRWRIRLEPSGNEAPAAHDLIVLRPSSVDPVHTPGPLVVVPRTRWCAGSRWPSAVVEVRIGRSATSRSSASRSAPPVPVVAVLSPHRPSRCWRARGILRSTRGSRRARRPAALDARSGCSRRCRSRSRRAFARGRRAAGTDRPG